MMIESQVATSTEVEVADIDDYDLIAAVQRIDNASVQLFLKRCFDIVGASVLILILSPVLIFTTLAIKLGSKGPIFFVQKRLGQNGKIINFIKFRSMYTDWSERRPEDVKLDCSKTGNLLKLVDDPRVTPIGKWIRKFSIDELPQLFNVLDGSMSLVGPRPLMLHMLEPYPKFSHARHLVKPGITGLWQIRDRSRSSNACYMIQHDLEYVRTYRFKSDLKILLETVPAVLSARGAF